MTAILFLCYSSWPQFNGWHPHSMSGSSIWDSLECQCCFWIAEGLVSYLTMWLLTLQLFKNSTDTQEKLRLNFHSLSVSELLQYGHRSSLFRLDFSLQSHMELTGANSLKYKHKDLQSTFSHGALDFIFYFLKRRSLVRIFSPTFFH